MKFTYDTKTDDRECVAYLHSVGSMFFNCADIYNKGGKLQSAVCLGGIFNTSQEVVPNGTGDLDLVIEHDGNMGHKFYKGDSLTITF